MALKFDNRYGLAVKKTYEDHTLTAAAYLHKERQLDYVSMDYKFKYGDGVFGLALNVNAPVEDDRTFEKIFNYSHKFGNNEYGAELKVWDEDNKMDKKFWAKYLNDDGLGFKTEIAVNDEGNATIKDSGFYKD